MLSKMTKELVIFDFDFTLADSSKGIVKSIQYASRFLNLKIPPKEDIINTIGLDLASTFNTLHSSETDDKIPEFVKHFLTMSSRVMRKSTVVYNNVGVLFSSLKNSQIKVAILSTKLRETISQVLEDNDLLHFVDCIIGGEDVLKHKPNTEGMNKIIRHMNVPAENILYVGDNIVDAKVATDSKVDFLPILTGNTTLNAFNDLGYYEALYDIIQVLDYIELLEKPC